MADKLDGSAIVANTIPSNRIQTGSITSTQLQTSLYNTVTSATHPKIRSISYPGNDTAANTGGGDTVTLRGTGFGNTGNVQIYINGNVVSSITVTNANSISFTAPALAAATYPVYLINTSDGSTAILIPGIQYSGMPSWSTSTPLSNQDASSTWSIQLVATSDSAVSYSLQAGSSLPAGITLAANGLISGTMTSPPSDETTYNFTVVANDLENQDASRAFSVTVTVAALDPFFTYTTLLLHGDGTNNANNHAFVDSSNNAFTITRNGNATQGTFSPFGDNWSNYFDGNGDNLAIASNAAFGFGTGDFSIEFWTYVTSTSNSPYWLDGRSTSTASESVPAIYSNAGNFEYWVNGAARISSGTVPLNQWIHVAVVRSGATTTFYVNGISIGTWADSTNYATTALVIGQRKDTTGQSLSGYMSNLRIIKGTAVYTSAFTPPTAPLTAIANTSLLTCQSNAFIDKGPNRFAITRNGDTRVSKFDPFKPYKAIPASYGVYFDGNGDYLTTSGASSFQGGTGDWTIEAWLYLTNSSNNDYIINGITSGGTDVFYIVFVGTAFYLGDGSSNTLIVSNTKVLNSWFHLAVVKNSSTYTAYINGTSIGSTSSALISTAVNSWQIGARTSQSNYITGHISNLRVVKGTAVYTSTFTPPTSPRTAIANTSLLTCQSTTIIDNSTNAFTITTNGDARPTDLNPFTTTFVSEKYNTANVGGSGYFDGSGDYLTTASSANLAIGANNFCIEYWVYSLNTNEITPFGQWATGNADWILQYRTGPNQFRFYYNSSNELSGNYTMVPNQWTHVAVCRSGTTMSLYVNGTRLATKTDSTSINNGRGLTIGVNPDGPIQQTTGYITDARIVVGSSIYIPSSSTLIVPTTPLTAITNTKFLCNFTNAGIIDSVGKNVLETVGDARVNTSVKKYGTGSMYFDGTGDYLRSPYNPDLQMKAADFTFECWVYMPSAPADYGLIFNTRNSNTQYSPFQVYIKSTRVVEVYLSTNGSTFAATITTTMTVPLTTWTHIAVVRLNGVVKIYINGVADGASATVAGSLYEDTSWGNNIGAETTTTGIGNAFIGNIDDLRITRGAARYRYNFTPPTKAFNDGDGSLANNTTDVLVGDQVNLPVFPYTTLLLHGDGTNNANNHAFLDSSNNAFAITRNGNATQGTFSPFSPTGWSVNIPDGSYYTTNTALMNISSSSQTFTAEAWIYPTAINSSGPQNYRFTSIFSKGIVYLSFGFTSGGVLRFYTYNGSENYINSASGLIKTNEWQHVAIVSNAGSITLYYNGISVATGSLVVPNGGMSEVLKIGHGDTTNNYQPDRFIGYMSNLRITNTAVYTAAFTPSIIPLTSISGTQLLTFKDNRLLDNSNNSYSITVNGSPSIQAFSPFAPSVEYTANTHGGSAYFDGTGDYLTLADNAAFTVGSDDFTVDFWIYNNTTGARRFVYGQSNSAGQNVSIPFSIYKNASNKLQFDVFASGSGTQYSATSSADLPLNQWVHVACVRNGGTTRIYINGVQDGTNATISTTTLVDSSNLVGIGSLGEYTSDLWLGYISNLRFIKGTCLYPSGTTFTPSTSPVTAVANTQLLCNFTNAGILDSTGKNVLETVGDARVNTAIKKYGTGSMYFDGTGDYLVTPSTAVNTLAGDFTVEMWVYRSAGNNFFFTLGDSFGSTGFDFYIGNTGANLRLYSGNSVVIDNALSSVNFPTSTWTHLAIVRSSGSVRVYVAGMQAGSAWSSTAVFSGKIYVGAEFYNGSITGTCNGYMDDVRVTNGIARYVTNFTPPTAAFLNK